MLGPTDGVAEGELVGPNEGADELGIIVGRCVGESEGGSVGLGDGDMLGPNDGRSVVNAPTADGAAVGVLDGTADGLSVGAVLGSIVGVTEGQ